MWMPRRSRVAPCTIVQRKRALPEPGQVLVQAGDFVQAMDAVAQISLPSGLHAIDVAQSLGMQAQDIGPLLVKEVGDTVAVGEAVAARKGALGLFQRVCSSVPSVCLALAFRIQQGGPHEPIFRNRAPHWKSVLSWTFLA